MVGEELMLIMLIMLGSIQFGGIETFCWRVCQLGDGDEGGGEGVSRHLGVLEHFV